MTVSDASMPPLGHLLAGGTGRRVYLHGNDSTLVVKVAKEGYEEFNREEARVWGLVQQGCNAEWFAPVVGADLDGRWLVMARTRPATKKEHYPSEVPYLFRDVKYCNWGWLDGRMVCHDYHVIQLDDGYNLRPAGWADSCSYFTESGAVNPSGPGRAPAFLRGRALRISVCAAYWKRQPALDAMVAQYDRLYPDMDIELSICDDGSPEPAVAPPHVILTRLPGKLHPLNPCVPINRAVEASFGEIIVLTNPEIEHREPVLGAMLAMLEHEDDYVTARCWDERWNLAIAGHEVRYDERGRGPVPPGAHFHFLAMFRRSLWDRAGGFDEDYRHGKAWDDADWLWRAHRVGARFKHCELTVYHDSKERIKWNMPHNGELFARKWPEAKWTPS